jgi:hypothetical protein
MLSSRNSRNLEAITERTRQNCYAMRVSSNLLYSCIRLTILFQSQSHFTTDDQSVSTSWCRAPSGAHDQILITVWHLLFCRCRAPPLTRGRSQSHITTDDQCVLVSNINFNYRVTVTVLSISSAPSDERSGLSFDLVTWTASVQCSKFPAGPRQHSISPYL